MRFLRQSDMLDHRSRIKARLRKSDHRIRVKCQSYFETISTTTFTYDVADLAKMYNGGGQRGTGGPKGEWLEVVTEKYVEEHHPELRMTKVVKIFKALGWFIIFIPILGAFPTHRTCLDICKKLRRPTLPPCTYLLTTARTHFRGHVW